jgi:hypothetical protein
VQQLILRRMMAKPSVALSVLCLGRHRQQATEAAAQEKFAQKVQCAASLLRNAELQEIAA